MTSGVVIRKPIREIKVEKIYFDLDGTLADFDKYLYDHCGIDPLPQEKREREGIDVWDEVRSIPHFFYRLEVMKGMKELFDELYDKYGDKVEILTGVPKPSRNLPTVKEDKINWVRKNLSDKIKVNTVRRKEKKEFCKGKGCILIDDYNENINDWKSKGGTAILYETPFKTRMKLRAKGVL